MTLIHGDCLEEMKNIVDKSVDMILCDLPYGTTNCTWDVIIPFDKLWEQYNRIIKDGRAIVLFGSEPFSSLLRCSNLKKYKYDWVWDKKKPANFPLAKKQPMKYHENISVFNSNVYYPIMVDVAGRKAKKGINDGSRIFTGGDSLKNPEYLQKIYTDKYPSSIIEISNADNYSDRHHPTQKPIALMEYLIKTYTCENETILDNTMGSGTTGVACVNTNRNFIGIEKEKEYFDIAEKRIKEAEQEIIKTKNLKKFIKV